MKVALIRPNYKTHLITPPLGIGYISSYLKKQGHEVVFVDGLNLNLSVDEIVQATRDCAVAGITALTDFYLQAKEIMKKLQALGKIVVLGGVHATVLPEETLKDTGADYIIVGEGELTFAELLCALEKTGNIDAIRGLYGKNKTTAFAPREFVKNLDELPFPDWEAMDPRKYQKAPHGALIKNFPVAPITTSRGCPYECKFCVSPKFWKRQIRFRSPENVIAESDPKKVREFNRLADEFNADLARIIKKQDLITVKKYVRIADELIRKRRNKEEEK